MKLLASNFLNIGHHEFGLATPSYWPFSHIFIDVKMYQ
jgi:hypothetical protein